jgi:hypothetical protein
MGSSRRYLGRSHGLIALCAAAPLLFCADKPQTSAAAGVKRSALASARINGNYGNLPMSFEENRGQTDRSVKFVSQGQGYSMFLTPSEVVLSLQSAPPVSKSGRHASIRMAFSGAKAATVTGEDRQAATSSYFVGNDPAKWVTGAPNYSRVRYQGLYPGVDLVFYGNQRQLEYDLVVAPGADPRTVHLQFDGVDTMRVDGAGNLVLNAGNGEVQQHRPAIYQERDGIRERVDGRYVIQPHNRVTFEIAHYDRSKPLVIDPVLSFATYLGTPGEEVFQLSEAAATATYPAIAVDAQGSVYLTGFNGGNASNFPGHPLNLGPGGTEVFVVKMNSTGTALLYSAVFGGGLTDVGGGIAVDSLGNAYVTGYTNSTNFPTTPGAPQNTLNGSNDAFIAKINAAGNALVYSTYLGGTGDDRGRAIAVDHAGNAYVTGATASTSGFTLVSPLLTSGSGFLAEVNETGTGFLYSTYLSGIGYGIAVDSDENAYVTGTTGTIAPVQGYVLKVIAGGSPGYGPVLLGNTGGSLQTVGFGIALDASGNAYVTGMTNDSHFPQITGGAAQSTYGGGAYDGFAIKLTSSGSLPPVYGTYIGGLGTNILPERGSSIGVDVNGNAYVSGTTQCINFPETNSIGNARNGGPAVLMKGSASGSNSTWTPATLAGSFDQVTALAFSGASIIYAGASAFNAAGGGVYKSTDGGTTWAAANSGITSSSIDAIAVDPSNSNNVYAAGSGHLYKSTNAGTSWTELSQTVGGGASIAISSTTVYVGSSTGLIYSTNGGTSWTAPATSPAPVNSIVIYPGSTTVAYAASNTGVFQTTNGGASWTQLINGSLPSPVQVTSLAITAAATLYAATPSGLFYIPASGTWTSTQIGVGNYTPQLVAVDASSTVYAAIVGSGIAVGITGGTSQSDWSALTYSGLTHNAIVALVVPPGASGTVFAGIVAGTDAFLTEISPDGGSFLSSTCIGGSDNDLGQKIAVTPGGAVYMSGATISANFPTTPGVVQPSLAGLYDAFALGIDVPPAQVSSPEPGIILSGSLATFSWNAVTGATQYSLSVGTTPGGTNIFNGTTTGTSQTVTFIPCTGGNVYVQLAAEVNGSFQTAADYSYPCKSGIGDFNGDHLQDLVWQNNATGQVNVNYFGGVGPQPQGSAVLNNSAGLAGWHVVGTGDFDSNGVPDLVWQNDTTGQVNVNYYGGAGGISIIGWACLNCNPNLTGWKVVAVADMNGDGVPDLIWQNTVQAK